MTTVHEATPVPESAPEPKPKRAKKAKAPVATTEAPASELAQEPMPETSATEQPAPEPSAPKPTKSKTSSKRPGKGPAANMTLALLREYYVSHLEMTKSPGTALSYRMEIDRACEFLGADTLIGSITPDDVARFNSSALVMRKKDGSPKAQPSYLKTRRVLRLCLVWAANDRKWLESAPIPVETAESK